MSSADPADTSTATSGDALAEVRDRLERVGDLPVEGRVAVFERANEVLARELTVLDEV